MKATSIYFHDVNEIKIVRATGSSGETWLDITIGDVKISVWDQQWEQGKPPTVILEGNPVTMEKLK